MPRTATLPSYSPADAERAFGAISAAVEARRSFEAAIKAAFEGLMPGALTASFRVMIDVEVAFEDALHDHFPEAFEAMEQWGYANPMREG